MTKTGVLLCGHGSRDPEAIAEFQRAAAGLRPRLRCDDFATGYLEFADPTVRDGLAVLAGRGATQICAVPVMLFAASHVKNDLPREIDRFAATHRGVDVRLARDLSADAKLRAAAAERIAAATPGRRDRTLLLVVGRGTSDPDANSNIAELARMLRDGMRLGRAEAAFSGVAQPRVAPALRHAAGLGFGRIVVFPYFLFTGILVKRIYSEIDAAAVKFPAIEFVKAGYLSDHPLVLDTLAERVDEIAGGERR